MSCKKPGSLMIWLINTFWVLCSFLIVEIVYYSFFATSPNPYAGKFPLEHLLWLLLASGAYAHVYNKASRIWRPVPRYADHPSFTAAGFQDNGLLFGEAFFYNKALKSMDEADYCKATWPKIANGIFFSLLLFVLSLALLMMGQMLITTICIQFLEAIRGVPPEGSVDSGRLISTGVGYVLAGGTLERLGKTEDDPR